MIPTRYKARLPRHLSYPLGAEAISEALAGAPHVEALSLTFSNEPVWPAAEFRRLLGGRLPYNVMAAEYRPARKPGLSASSAMVQRGWYDETWELKVYPVLAELRHLANRLLHEEGLPAVVTWLQSSGRAGWAATSQRIELAFDSAGEALACRERHGA